MITDATLKDFLITIGGATALAAIYFATIREPGRNAVTRFFDRWTDVWSQRAWEVPKRAQLWIVAVLSSLIALGALIGLCIRLVQGRVR
jgi:hypothetical protein